MKASQPNKTKSIPLLAMCLAWLVPGAGHVYMGRATRGVVLFITVSALFWSGIAMGGVTTVDQHRERWWFISQMFTGANGLVAWQLQQRTINAVTDKNEELRQPLQDPAKEAERLTRLDELLAARNLALVAPTDGVARAYSGVAGLLNLMCIFDALMLSLMGMSGEPAPPANPRKPGGEMKTW